MAHKEDYQSRDITFPDQKIVEINLEHEMENAYIEYAMSVIVGRALPDVRDGLKPVHRRILYSMYESGLTSDKPFKKSATCVGDVLGKYHPHGDASVYDAMVRLAQDFSMRYPLVDGHGNFGSVDGDPPAAYRYTEARMSKMCNEMLRDIDKDTVDWDPNFDESLKEPRVLPSRFPNLLVNGSSGIAVGMTTNIPPHNLREVIDATICVLDNEHATLDDLMEHIKGPDFPTRGIIMGRAGIRAAYATGRGHIKVRARTEMEEFGNGRTRIIVTELPYQVNKSRLVENIAEDLAVKRAFFRRLSPRVAPWALLTTNTSGLRVTDVAQGAADPAVTGFERPPPGEIQVVPRTQYVRPEPLAQGDFFWRKQYERYQISMCHDL